MTAVRRLLIGCSSTNEPPSKEGSTATSAELEGMFTSLRRTDPRKAGEVVFALTCRYHEGGDVESARESARECVSIFDGLNAQGKLKTMEDCAARFGTLGGVVIPPTIHEGIVKSRFYYWGVKL